MTYRDPVTKRFARPPERDPEPFDGPDAPDPFRLGAIAFAFLIGSIAAIYLLRSWGLI